MKDNYAILGVSRSASPDEIHRAWRKLSLANGVDRLPSDVDSAIRKFAEDRQKHINNAHDDICDHSRRRPGSTSSAGTSSARPSSSWSTNSSGDSGSKKEEPKPPPPPPPPPPPKPPKAYNPVIRSSAYDIALDAIQGDEAEVTFQVFHESGELPPRWKLSIRMDGVLLQDTDVSYYPTDSLPTTVSARIHVPQDTGELTGEISIVLVEVN